MIALNTIFKYLSLIGSFAVVGALLAMGFLLLDSHGKLSTSAKKLHSLHNIFNLFKKECITNENIISYSNQCLESILPYE